MKEETTRDLWLARYAGLVVLATFVLIVVGGHTTTSGAGMAFPDWPLSHGSINPDGWWEDLAQRLEHGHRIIAETVGLLIGVLCAWIWGNLRAVPVAIACSAALAVGAYLVGAPRPLVMHLGLWSSVVVFVGMLFMGSTSQRPATLRWLSFGAFLGVCLQALMGGLRVTIESGGNVETATIFRIAHGCFAQLELCLLVIIAGILSPVAAQIQWRPDFGRISKLAWATVGIVFCQLILGASMRHHGAGLAIPTFPQATPDGRWLPASHNFFVDLNYTHTRVGALLVSVFVVWLAIRVFRHLQGEQRIQRLAGLLLGLLLGQLLLGMFVIWNLRPPILTTLHVVNGAALLAATVLLATRTTRAFALHVASSDSALSPPSTRSQA